MKKLLTILALSIPLSTFAVDAEFTQKVADISVGYVVERDSLPYKRAKTALENVEKLCLEQTAEKTANQSEAASQVLRKHNISANIIDVLEVVATLKPQTQQSCQDIITQYAQLRENATHTDATVQLNALYKTLKK
ncbi:hypothetical protein BKG95_10290 [Rodentibacter pneumotropicus]|uniref:Uncharacterized protein n=1 Tax=Rodentibacter pneumotropicus TaxID=758 RepID=A0AAW5LCH2_9PAST|nr:hypothetical protein [Rodentibacter pneumotropicus]MCQ9121277.1 hypothetical protein [Rodentibacter pneumotropicus]OOF66588.1 hypothetical protein BKG95_10290 [Rodentibacter pneumotropicus]